jgi:hypothetical protein
MRTQERDRWGALGTTAMNLGVTQQEGEFLINWATIISESRVLLHRFSCLRAVIFRNVRIRVKIDYQLRPVPSVYTYQIDKFIYRVLVRVSDYWSSWGFDSRFHHGDFSLKGKIPMVTYDLGSLVELRFKAPPGTSYSYITIHFIGTT